MELNVVNKGSFRLHYNLKIFSNIELCNSLPIFEKSPSNLASISFTQPHLVRH